MGNCPSSKKQSIEVLPGFPQSMDGKYSGGKISKGAAAETEFRFKFNKIQIMIMIT